MTNNGVESNIVSLPRGAFVAPSYPSFVILLTAIIVRSDCWFVSSVLVIRHFTRCVFPVGSPSYHVWGIFEHVLFVVRIC